MPPATLSKPAEPRFGATSLSGCRSATGLALPQSALTVFAIGRPGQLAGKPFLIIA